MPTDPQPRLPLVEILALSDEFGQCGKCRVVKVQKRVVYKQELLRALRQSAKQRAEGHGLIFDGDQHTEVKPVILLAWNSRDRKLWLALSLPVVGSIPRSANFNTCKFFKLRHSSVEKLGCISATKFDSSWQLRRVFCPGLGNSPILKQLKWQQFYEPGIGILSGALPLPS